MKSITLKNFILPLAWFAFISVMLTLPGSSFPKETWLNKIYFDKIFHVSIFFILVLLFFWPFTRTTIPESKKKRIFFVIILSAIAYGVIIEFIQKYWIPGRSFELMDIIADASGSILVIIFYKQLNRIPFEKKLS